MTSRSGGDARNEAGEAPGRKREGPPSAGRDREEGSPAGDAAPVDLDSAHDRAS